MLDERGRGFIDDSCGVTYCDFLEHDEWFRFVFRVMNMQRAHSAGFSKMICFVT